MWRLGFFFHEMGFGLLSIFLPLYVVSKAVQGSLYDIGIMSAVALFLAIPASFFWGYLCDKTRHYKRFILLSFSASAAILCLLTFSKSVGFLILLYAVMSFLHVAHEPPKNVLIAESYSHEDWERSFAFYEGLTEAGWLIGLVLGFLASSFGLEQTTTLLLCSILNLVAFGMSLLLVSDPSLVFERSMVSIEKSVDFACRGVFLASRMLNGAPLDKRLRRENLTAFCGGLVLFSLATSILFTPMPIFVADLASEAVEDAVFASSLVFAIFVLNSGGAVVGYYLAARGSSQRTEKSGLSRIVLFRGILSLLLLTAIWHSFEYNIVLVTAILIFMGLAYALFLVHMLSLSMELIPVGKAGLFNVLIGVGGACGSFIGPFIASQPIGFRCVFVVAGLVFLGAYVAFRIFMKKK